MPDMKNDLLRRYLDQNNFKSLQDPITMEQGVELERLKMLYNSPSEFRQAILQWEEEQKEKSEKDRKEYLDKLEAERQERFRSPIGAAEQIALAKGKQAQIGIGQLQAIKDEFDRMKFEREMERQAALQRQRLAQKEQEENSKAYKKLRMQDAEEIIKTRIQGAWDTVRREQIQIETERRRQEYERERARRLRNLVPVSIDWTVDGSSLLNPEELDPEQLAIQRRGQAIVKTKQPEPDIPMAPRTNKRRIKLRD